MSPQETSLQEVIKRLSAFSSNNQMAFAYLLLEVDEKYQSYVESNRLDTTQQDKYQNMISLIITNKWNVFPPEKQRELVNTLKSQCINNPDYNNGPILDAFINNHAKTGSDNVKTNSYTTAVPATGSMATDESMKLKGPSKKGKVILLAVIALFVGVCFIVPNVFPPSTPSTSNKGSSRTESLDNYIEQKHAAEAAEAEDETLTPVAEPANGTILYGTESGDSSITVTASSLPCVVKLLDANQNDVVAFYVAANSTATVAVPATDLYVHFAEGTTWYGYDNLFGKNTQYSAEEDPLFSETLDFYEYTYTFELYLQDNGNFEPIDIPADAF